MFKPVMEVKEFNVVDVITTSDCPTFNAGCPFEGDCLDN